MVSERPYGFAVQAVLLRSNHVRAFLGGISKEAVFAVGVTFGTFWAV